LPGLLWGQLRASRSGPSEALEIPKERVCGTGAVD
jgi:hypothetical protein